MEIIGGNDGAGELDKSFLLGFIQEVDSVVPELEKKLIELEQNPADKELINSVFRSFHNIKGSAAFLSLRTMQDLMHYAESLLDLVRKGRSPLSERIMALSLDVLSAMKEVADSLRHTEKEGDKRHFGVLAGLTDEIARIEGSGAGAGAGEDPKSAAGSGGSGVESGRDKTGAGHGGQGEDDEIIKINKSLVEQLMLVVGDFMACDSRFHWLARRYPGDVDFFDNCRRLSSYLSSLQKIVLRMRLSSVRGLFDSLHRVARTTCQETKKKVHLEVSGSDTLIDRNILGVMNEPLIHMIRNAIDHGIESPDERVGSNKAAEGLLSVSAFYRGGEVCIQVSDDGKGVDAARIKRKALEKGLITEAEAAVMTEPDAQKLIFLPGFSSAEQVTSISGRGVGMDVVRSTVESVGGAVELASSVGVGTTVTLKLPMSLSIVECLEFCVGNQLYAVARVNVEEVHSLQSPLARENYRGVNHDNRIFMVRDVPVPVLPLARLFEMDEADLERRHLILVKSGNVRFALEVADIIGPCSLVTQILPPVFSEGTPFSGATQRGDGSLLFQLDLSKLAAHIDARPGKRDSGHGRFSSMASTTSSDFRRLQQKMITFKNHQNFCLPVQIAKRMVLVSADAIQEVAGKSYVTLDGTTVPLVWLEETLLKKDRIRQDSYSLIVYHVDDHVFGLPLCEFKGIVRMPTLFDDSIRSECVLGATVIEGESVLVLDLPALTAKAYSESFSRKASKRDTAIKTVLVAEDDPFFREQILSFLASYDYTTFSACDGLEAKQLLQNPEFAQKIDAVVSDIEMPRLDGLSLVRWINSNDGTRRIPCIMLTAVTTKEMIRAATVAGARAYIAKMQHGQVLAELKKLGAGINDDGSGLRASLLGASEGGTHARDRLVTFEVGGHWFALPMDALKEVSPLSSAAHVPNYASWMKEVTSFRGRFVPVIDLARLFGFAQVSAPGAEERAAEARVQPVLPGLRQQLILEWNDSVVALTVAQLGEVVLRSSLTQGEGLAYTDPLAERLRAFSDAVFRKNETIITLLSPKGIVENQGAARGAGPSPMNSDDRAA